MLRSSLFTPQWKGLFPADQGGTEQLGVFVNAYADESGKSASHTMIVCGYAAPWDVWNDLQNHWEDLLSKHEIPYLHTAELMRWEGPYEARKDEWGDDGRASFHFLPRGLILMGMSFTKELLSEIARAWPITHLEFMRSRFANEQPLRIVTGR